MHESSFHLLILILAVGVGIQWLADRLRLPSLLLLLAAGITLGPGTGLLDPDEFFGDLFKPIISMAVALVLSRGLNGATSTLTPMVIDVAIGFLLTLPLAFWLTGVSFFGLTEGGTLDPSGAWWAAVLSHTISGVVYVQVFLRGSWRHKVVAPSGKRPSS